MRNLVVALSAVALLATGTYPVSAADPPRQSPDTYREMVSSRESAELGRPGGARSYTAAEACLDAPRGDTMNMSTGSIESYPKADITRFCGTYGDMIRLAITPAEASNPNTDPNWVHGLTGTLSTIDLNGDGEGDYMVFYSQPESSGLVVDVTDPDLNIVCQGTPGYDGTSFTASFPPSCIGSPTSLRVDSFLMYDSRWDDPDAPLYADATSHVSVAKEAQPQPEPEPQPDPEPQPVVSSPATREKGRLAGEDRFQTAARISRHAFPQGAAEVYLARADSFPDALAGGALTEGPVLLVPGCAAIPQVVKDEIRRLDPSKVIALGGASAVCEAVLDEALRS